MQSSAFEMVEMDKIVSGKRGWVTRGLIEYAWWGDRPFFGKAMAICFDKAIPYGIATRL